MSKSIKASAIEDFKSICRKEFNYLLADAGFQEDDSSPGEFENEFQIRFIGPDFKEGARFLQQYGKELMKGDLSIFEEILEKERTAWEEYESRRKFGVAEQEAVASKSQNWQKVVEVLEPYEQRISGRMAGKLRTARRYLQHENQDIHNNN